MATYTGATGGKYILGQQLGVGGEGVVYELSGNSACVAKVYKTTRFKSESEKETMERKLKAMLAMNISATVDGLLRLAWPQDILYENNKIVGFVMPRVNTKYKIFDVYRTGKNSLRELEYSDYTWKYSVQFAYNMAWVVNYLHRHNIVIGDLNQNNIAVDAKTGAVILIDCDSFDIRDPRTGEHFPCEVGLEEMLAPELQTVGKLTNGTFTKESDNFSLAIHIFRLLMNNEDPFGGVMTTNSSQSSIPGNRAIINGECLYVRNVPGKTWLPRMPKLDILPQNIQQLFRRTFDYTATTALSKKNNRATAEEWKNALYVLAAPEPNNNLKTCYINPKHVYPSHNASCPWCAIEKAGHIPAPNNTNNSPKAAVTPRSSGNIPTLNNTGNSQTGTGSISGNNVITPQSNNPPGGKNNKIKTAMTVAAILVLAILIAILVYKSGIIGKLHSPLNTATEQISSLGESMSDDDDMSILAVGDVITLGRYEQDNNIKNGAEDICWEVKEIAGNKALLVSKYALDAAPFHSEKDNSTWENSTLRGWLNSYFLDAAFSDDEQSLIIQSSLETPAYGWDGKTLTKLSTVEKTTDMVFIEEYGASVSDASSYSLQTLLGSKHNQAVQLNDDVFPSKWLRNPVVCETNEIKSIVLGYYSDKSKQVIISSKKFALVCPSIYIDLSTYEAYMSADHSNEKSKLTRYYEACDATYQNGLQQGLYKQVLVSDRCIYCLKNDGTIEVLGYQYQWRNPVPFEIDYSKWTDIESITVLDGGTLEVYAMARFDFIVNERGIAALRKDGTVLVLSNAFQGTVDAANWTDIVQITSSSGNDLIGLKRDGTVHYISANPPWATNEDTQDGLTYIDGSAKIFAVQEKGTTTIFGLSENGTILYDKDNGIRTYDKTIGEFVDIINKWSKLKDVAVCRLQTDVVGLTNNGKVLYGGGFGYGGDEYTLNESVINSWDHVTAIAAGYSHLVGLRDDGTVCAVGKNDYGQCNVDDWTNIDRISAFGVSTIGYRKDGSILVAGNNPIESILAEPFTYENAR